MTKTNLISLIALLILVVAIPAYGMMEPVRMVEAKADLRDQHIKETIQVYLDNCALCHEVDGLGSEAMPALNSEALAGASEQALFNTIARATHGAGMAAWRATSDDLVVLEAIRQEQLAADPGDPRRLFEIDHKFHKAIAQAAHNKYLAQTLDHFFGLSLRLWYLVLPHLEFLPRAVEKHLELADAIRSGDAAAAERIMHSHVESFYTEVRRVLATGS